MTQKNLPETRQDNILNKENSNQVNYIMPIPFTNQVHTNGKTNQNQGRVPGKYNMMEITISDTKKIAQSVGEPFFNFSIFVGFVLQIYKP